MFFNPEADGPGFYAITRYADIREVHRNVDIYSSEIAGPRSRTSTRISSRRASR